MENEDLTTEVDGDEDELDIVGTIVHTLTMVTIVACGVLMADGLKGLVNRAADKAGEAIKNKKTELNVVEIEKKKDAK